MAEVMRLENANAELVFDFFSENCISFPWEYVYCFGNDRNLLHTQFQLKIKCLSIKIRVFSVRHWCFVGLPMLSHPIGMQLIM